MTHSIIIYQFHFSSERQADLLRLAARQLSTVESVRPSKNSIEQHENICIENNKKKEIF